MSLIEQKIFELDRMANAKGIRPRITTISAYSRNLSDALDDVQSAKNCGDDNALGYAEGRVLRWKREIAKLDPRGYGAQHLGTLSDAERESAMAK